MLPAAALLTLFALQAPPPPPLLGDPVDDAAEPAEASDGDPRGEQTEAPDEVPEDDRADQDSDIDNSLDDSPAPVPPAEERPPSSSAPPAPEDVPYGEGEVDGYEYGDPVPPQPERRPRSRPAPEEEDRPAQADGSVPAADPIQETLQVDAGTFAIHTLLVCGWAILMMPVGCVPCMSWVLYPGAVGLGVDQIGRYLTDKRGGGLLVPATTFFLLEMLGGAVGVASMLAGTVVLAALASGTPEVAVLLSGTPSTPPLAGLLAYGGLLGAAATATLLAAVGATASWHIAARDDRGEGLFEQLNPFDDDEREESWKIRRRRRDAAALNAPALAMRY